MKQNRFSSMVQAMALVLYLSFVSAAQAQFDAVVNAALPSYHQAPNCPDFISKAPTDWICKIAGTGNTSIPGWGWSQTDGVDLINQAVSQHFSAIIYYSDARNDQDTIYSAALNGCALSCFHTSDNNHTFYDYNYQSPNGRVFGPMASMIVSGGFSSGSGAVTAYGPQGEFMDARLDGSLDGNGNPQYAAEQSYAHATTAAKYAQIKSYHPDWN